MDARSDPDGLGAVASFLLTGEPPFRRKSVGQLLAAHRHETAAFPDRPTGELPADAKAVVLRCSDKEPAGRYQDPDGLESARADCKCAKLWTCAETILWRQRHTPTAPDAAPGAAPAQDGEAAGEQVIDSY